MILFSLIAIKIAEPEVAPLTGNVLATLLNALGQVRSFKYSSPWLLLKFQPYLRLNHGSELKLLFGSEFIMIDQS